MTNQAMSVRVNRSMFQFSIKARQRLSLIIATFIVFGVFGLHTPLIWSVGNIENILIQSSYLMLIAAAQSVVILTRGLDLSLGVTISLVSVVCAMVMTSPGAAAGSMIVMGLACGLFVGVAVGAFNAFWIAVLRINPFIVTLGTMNIVLTLSTTISGGFPVSPLPEAFGALATARPLGIPIQLMVAAAALLLTHIALSRTVFGRSLTMIGSNPQASLVAGIPVRLHLFGAYILCSLLVALAAVMLTARTGSGEPSLGNDFALLSIAAAVLGGMSLRGGHGDMFAPLLGALFVTVLSNCMNLARIDGYIQQILLGVVIILALGIDQIRSRYRT